MKQTEQFKTTERFLLNFRLITDEGKKPFRFNEVINDLHYCIQINAFERATVISAWTSYLIKKLKQFFEKRKQQRKQGIAFRTKAFFLNILRLY